MVKCFIVVGYTGEYDDAYQWNARVFLDEEKAKNFCVFLNEKLKELGVHWDSEYRPNSFDNEYQVAIDAINTFDNKFHSDYTGVYYEVTECVLDK